MAYHNIEKSGFHKGEYVSYVNGLIYKIKKTNSTYGNWVSYIDYSTPCIYAFTLRQMSEKLEKMKTIT